MVLGKLSDEGGPFPGHLACLRKELNFSARNYLWLRCSSKGERDRPWKSVGGFEITNQESAGGGGGFTRPQRDPETGDGGRERRPDNAAERRGRKPKREERDKRHLIAKANIVKLILSYENKNDYINILIPKL